MIQVTLDACDRRDLHSHTLVLDVDRIDPTLLIHTPDQYCIWYDAEEVVDDNTGNNVPFERERYTPYVSILATDLDLSIGFHSYSIKFVHRRNETKYFWACFGYIAQSTNPETPYIYMNRSIPTANDTEEDLNDSEDEDGSNIFQQTI